MRSLSAKELLKLSANSCKTSMLSHRRPVIAADTQPVAASSAGGPSLGRGLQPDYDLEFDLDGPSTASQLALPTARDIEQLRAKVCLIDINT